MKIHFWAPNIFEFKGGIQTFSKFMLKALYENSSKDSIKVFLKHDKQAKDSDAFENVNYHCYGKVPSAVRTLIFSMGLIFYALIDKPDLIITTHVNFSPAAYILKKFLGINYWVVVHGTEVWGLSKKTTRKGLSYADKILSVSSFTKSKLTTEQGIDESSIKLFPNTFDERRFKISEKPKELLESLGISETDKIILTVSRLDPAHRSKGYDVILNSMPEILNKVPNAHYLLVGTGRDKERVENLVSSNGLKDKVTLAGFIPDEKLPEFYSACDIYAMPSQGEGFGIVYLEAMASGKPVLAGNIDGSVDPLVNGKLGILVDPRSSEEVAEGIIASLREQVSQSSKYSPEELRSEVINRFGFKAFSQNLKNCIDESSL